MRKIITRVITLLAVVVILFMIGRYTPLRQIFNVETLNTYLENIKLFIQKNYLLAALIFILAYISQTAAFLPAAAIFSILGGFLFGPLWSVLYINLGATTGSFINFFAARYFIGDSIHKKYEDKLQYFHKEIEENGTNYMFTLRLIPIFPFFLVNLLAGLTKIKWTKYLWTTSLGILPASFAYAYLGYSLRAAGESLEEAKLSPHIIIALVVLGLVGLIPVIYKKLKKE